MLEHLQARGIVMMYVSFSGSGDDGSVHNVEIVRREVKKGSLRPGHTLTADDFTEYREDLSWNDEKDIWRYANELAGEADFDWYNNEGGYGSITVDVEAGTAEYTRVEYIQRENMLPGLKINLITGKST